MADAVFREFKSYKIINKNMTKIEREKQRENKLNILLSFMPQQNAILEKAEIHIRNYNKALKNYWENGRNRDSFDRECIKAGLFDFRFGIYKGDKPNWNYDLQQLDKQYRILGRVK